MTISDLTRLFQIIHTLAISPRGELHLSPPDFDSVSLDPIWGSVKPNVSRLYMGHLQLIRNAGIPTGEVQWIQLKIL